MALSDYSFIKSLSYYSKHPSAAPLWLSGMTYSGLYLIGPSLSIAPQLARTAALGVMVFSTLLSPYFCYLHENVLSKRRYHTFRNILVQIYRNAPENIASSLLADKRLKKIISIWNAPNKDGSPASIGSRLERFNPPPEDARSGAAARRT